MKPRDNRIARAWLESPTRGVIELAQDWHALRKPRIALAGRTAPFLRLQRVPDYTFGVESGFFVNNKREIFFLLDPRRHPEIDWKTEQVYVAGDFNGWQQAIGREEWRLRPATLAGEERLLLVAAAAEFLRDPPLRFKFVTAGHHWFDVPGDTPNLALDGGNRNRRLDANRTGQHRFAFEVAEPLDLSESLAVVWRGGGREAEHTVPLRPGEFFHRLRSDLPLGALVDAAAGTTVFRVFAPRAKSVEVQVFRELSEAVATPRTALSRLGDGVWETRLPENLHGAYYWFYVGGPRDDFGAFDRAEPRLDPYVLAAVDRRGPGIVLDRAIFARPEDGFQPPAWQDLVIAEAHVRDLAALAPVRLRPEERLGFSGLRKWVESPEFYLSRLGVNAVELLPVAEFDNRTREEYHWGYMTANFFSPESSYALAPERASQVREFQELVAAFHRRGMAVILDVVYNHVGEPAHLLGIDKLYYFEQDDAGTLANWSGCGNDLRARSAMATRLIVDSLTHWIEAYGVDGFRFDLAELLGVEVLREVEAALKRVKPSVILIAEPWSFRGHIAGALRPTGYASWNDGYRDFVRDYLLGRASTQGLEYFLKGSPWHFAYWPAQTVNYVESHDDRTWIDVITENPDRNGFDPTMNDRRRTHLMLAILFSSLGIPMVAAGQDFLRSKRGVNNTYQRGDLNALDYKRLYRFPSSHAYAADWIQFRLSQRGRLFRQYTRPGEGFFRFFFSEQTAAAAALYNADGAQGPERLLFAVNPHPHDVEISLGGETAALLWRQVADHERFFRPGDHEPGWPVEETLFVPALSCALWTSG